MYLAPYSRTIIAGAALVCFAAAFVLTPSSVRSQIATAPSNTSTVPTPIVIPPIIAVPPRRDAFVPLARVDDGSTAPLHDASVLPAVPRDLAPHTATALTNEPHVTAVATGARATAIVEIAGDSRVVIAGDTLAGARILKIERGAIELDNGKRLSLSSDVSAP